MTNVTEFHGFDEGLDGLGLGDHEIDLRQEASDFLDNRGHYVFLRRRTEQHCPYWDSSKRECLEDCPYCNGTGHIKNSESVSIEIERAMKKILNSKVFDSLILITHPELDKYLKTGDREYFLKICSKNDTKLEFKTNDNFHLNEFQIFSASDGEKIDV